MSLEKFKRLGSHSAIYGISTAVSSSAGLILLPLLTHALTPAEYGTLELLVVLAAQLGVLTQLGIGSAVFKTVLHDDRERRGPEAAAAVATAFWTTLVVAGSATAALALVAPQIGASVLGSERNAGLLRWFLLRVFLDAVAAIPMVRLRLREMPGTFALLNVGRVAISIAVVALTLGYLRAGIHGLAVAMVVEAALFAAMALATAWRDLWMRPSLALVRSMLAFGIPLVPFAAGLTLLSLTDRYFLRVFEGLDAVGHYTVGYKVAAALAVPVRAFQVAWPVFLFSAAGGSDGDRFYSRLLTYFLVLLGLCAVVVSTFATELVNLLTSSAYADGARVVPVLVLAQMALGAFYVTAVGTNLEAKTYFQTISVAAALLVCAAGAVLLIPPFGAVGAAFAVVAAYTTLAAANCAFSLRLRPVAYEWRRVFMAVAATAVLLLATTMLPDRPVALRVVLQLALVGAYPVVMYLLVLTSAERARLRRDGLRAAAAVLLPASGRRPRVEEIRGIVVHAGMGIGNLIMYTPALRALRAALPKARITVLTLANGADEVLRGSDLVDEVVVVPPSLARRLLLGLRLRRQGQQVVISSFQGDDFKLITLLSGAPIRVGHVTSPGWAGRADFLYNVPVRMEEAAHEVDRKRDLIHALGVPAPDAPPFFAIDDRHRARARDFLAANGVGPGDRLVAVAIDVSRTQQWKRWHMDRLAEVCNALSQRPGVRLALIGAPDSAGEIAEWRSELTFAPIVTVGQLSLKETAALIEQADLTICSDSGLMHVAAAVGTPTLGIFGPTDYRRTAPTRYSPVHRIVRKPVECSPCFRLEGDAQVLACSHRMCLGLITAADVLGAAEEMLGAAAVPAGASVSVGTQ